MKKYIYTALFLLGIAGCSTPKKLSVGKDFTPLFDGKSTDGWHTYGKNTVDPAWRADAGVLHFSPDKKTGTGSGDLLTDKEYENFHLKLDWKVAPGSNSGIIYFVKEDPIKFRQPHMTGLEMQILDNDGHKDGTKDMHRAGDLYDLIRSSTEPVKAVGEWNTAEIISKGDTVEHFLNRVKIVSFIRHNEQWKMLVSESKFKNVEGWGSYKTGKIALQDHGNEVWFKDIQIKEL